MPDSTHDIDQHDDEQPDIDQLRAWLDDDDVPDGAKFGIRSILQHRAGRSDDRGARDNGYVFAELPFGFRLRAGASPSWLQLCTADDVFAHL